VYNYQAPMPLVYEFIHLKGKGAMHGSTGTAIAAEEMLRMTPPEVLRFLLMKYEPARHIDFDTGLGLLDLIDEYDKYEKIVFEAKIHRRHNQKIVVQKIPKEIDLTRHFSPPFGNEHETETSSGIHDFFFLGEQSVLEISSEGNTARAIIHAFADIERVYEFSQPFIGEVPQDLPTQVPYRHIVTLVQIAKTWEEVFSILKRNQEIRELTTYEEKKLTERIKKAQYWLQNFAPEQIKFEVKKTLPLVELTKEQKIFFEMLKKKVEQCEWNAEVIHATIHATAQKINIPASKAFQYLYTILLGQKKGPRAGYFIHSLGKEVLMKRLDEALEKASS
jgi:lysyl-tRNA synthetase class I